MNMVPCFVVLLFFASCALSLVEADEHGEAGDNVSLGAQASGRVAFGQAPGNKIPSFASLVTIQSSKVNTCAGVIVGRRHLITTAHCVTSEQGLSAFIGAYNGKESGEVVKGTNWTVHPKFHSNNRDSFYDIAVVELKDDIPRSSEQARAALATPSYRQALDDEDEQVVLETCGFGSTEESLTASVLQCAEMVLDSRVTCWDQVRNWFEEKKCAIKPNACRDPGESTIGCSPTRLQDGRTCQGDNGGPWYHERKSSNHPVLVGLTGFPKWNGEWDGENACKNSDVSIFTEVSEVVDFVGLFVEDLMVASRTSEYTRVESFRTYQLDRERFGDFETSGALGSGSLEAWLISFALSVAILTL